jgi:hypothetical protein
LQVCGPLLMAVILQFSLCFHELQWLMISVDECLLPKNVMSPLVIGLHNGVHFFWLWSLIIFLIQRSLLLAMFIPHEVFTPQKYVHSSTRGSA